MKEKFNTPEGRFHAFYIFSEFTSLHLFLKRQARFCCKRVAKFLY